MHNTDSNQARISAPLACITIIATAFIAAGCASVSVSGGGSGMPGSSGGGISLPGGGSSGGGSSEGSSGGGMPGGSSGGDSSGGGMPGGSSGGGMPGGSSGSPTGGASGGAGGAGGSGPMDSVEIPGGSGGASDCNDGGVMGGGIGGGMDCDNGQAGDVGQFPGGGDAERAEELGKELDKSVGDFDEVLMEEQREIETVGRNTEGYGTGGKGSGGSISLGEQAAGAQGGSGGGGGGGGGSGSRADPLEGMSEGEIEQRTPDDIAVIMDDDIVAKQLREAALAEEDPELRERLWEEYRKYKGM